jgi:hypothetical protein
VFASDLFLFYQQVSRGDRNVGSRSMSSHCEPVFRLFRS